MRSSFTTAQVNFDPNKPTLQNLSGPVWPMQLTNTLSRNHLKNSHISIRPGKPTAMPALNQIWPTQVCYVGSLIVFCTYCPWTTNQLYYKLKKLFIDLIKIVYLNMTPMLNYCLQHFIKVYKCFNTFCFGFQKKKTSFYFLTNLKVFHCHQSECVSQCVVW